MFTFREALSRSKLNNRVGEISLWLLILVVGVGLAWLSILRWQGFNLPAFDIGAIAQAIWNTAYQGEPLIFTRKGIAASRLAEHAEIFYFLLVPLYWLWASPAVLFIFQAVLFSLGAYPVYRIVSRRLHHKGIALSVAAIYLFYPVAQTAVLFEFHADTLAMPLLLFALEAVEREARLSYYFWLILALSCKFYVAAPVFVLGGVLWWRGRRRLGASTILLSVAWGAFAFFVVRPAFAPPEAATALKATGGSYLAFYFGQLYRIRDTIWLRLINGAFVFAPVILLGRRAAGWLLVAASVAGPVLLSSGPGPTYSYEFHHYALAVPFLIMAIIEGGAAIRKQALADPESNLNWRFSIVFTLTITLLLNVLIVDTPLNPRFYAPAPRSGRGWDPTGYQVTSRDRFKRQWLKTAVPPMAPLAADRASAMHLLERPILYQNDPLIGELDPLLPQIDYLVADALYDFVISHEGEIVTGGVGTGHVALPLMMQAPEWRLVEAQDGMLLFGRKGTGLLQELNTFPVSDERPALVAHFSDRIGLISADVEPLDRRRFLLQIQWVALQDLSESPPMMAVSHLDGIELGRIVHLPSLAVRSTSEWPMHHIVQERFVFELPANTPLGSYPLFVGWYDTGNIFAADTDERSRVGDLVQIGVVEVIE